MENRFTVKTIKVGHQRFELELFADLDREFTTHFDECADPTKDLPEPPLFGNLWPSAEGLALWMLKRQESWPDLRVLEIGCGLGLPSLLCARLGAKVEAMDHHPEVAPLLARNCRRNGVSSLTFHLASFQNVKTTLGSYDLILGSDILYQPELYPQLEAFLLRHAAPQCEIIIADPGRYAVPNFGPELKRRGRYQLGKNTIPGEQHPIDIHHYQLGY